ncbi:TIGR02680 family protein [Streptomonospora wellingtoniae]|uniref:TIGR02680 family protein n=1 Tax=Streptomonospora wellingtoniae TaxID=3075544 RepID=A0ABU2KZW9_9ACTN|nr:TIGR02680 family protein [Streptomonospora sp. DSM 45055]MDT0304850.1 TIGR02680 family protein [Streptomonospora sp. DSM 45055]
MSEPFAGAVHGAGGDAQPGGSAEPEHGAAVRDRLPVPARDRWQPLRLGLVDLFYYEDEEFPFRDGRLLLRGNNGTGKSKVLALSLPFLLDGNMTASRVEPDGDPKKRMEWNLLLGGEHDAPERLGYTWIEFGRADPSGTVHFRTLGCGLKAVAGKGIARHWFFVTTQRIGSGDHDGLRLLDNTRTALTRDRLAEAIGEHGRVYDSARDYRRAVDEELFGLGEERYRALVDLLIQLRQPQLSKRPDEAALSRALTQALPPLDDAVVADAAESFRSLDEDRAELDAMKEAHGAAERFLGHYRAYARVAALRRSRPPRERHADYERLREQLREAHSRRTAAESRVSAAEAAQQSLEERAARLGAEEQALREGPEMRDAQALDRAAEDARGADETLRSRRGDAERSAREHTRARTRLQAAEDRRRDAAGRVEGALRRAHESASAAGIGDAHDTGVAALVARAAAGAGGGDGTGAGTEEPGTTGGMDTAGAVAAAVGAAHDAAAGLAGRRERGLDHVERLAEAATKAETARTAAETRLADADEELAAREAYSRTAEGDAASAAAGLVDGVRAHLAGCTELRPAHPEGLLDRLQVWAADPQGPNPARTECDDAARGTSHILADAAAGVSVERRGRTEKRGELTAELGRLREGGQSAPPTPYTRSPGVRGSRPGAPLWRLVDFRDAVSDAERAGLESALEAAGLLDAWVAPDGSVSDAGTHDTVLRADGPAAEPTLASALLPAVDTGDAQAAAVAPDTVARLLESIGLGKPGTDSEQGPAAAEGNGRVPAAVVDVRGRFRLGVLRGRWSKDRAEFLGEGAREAARRARIEVVSAGIDDVDAAVAELDARSAEIDGRRAVLDAELADLPGDDAVVAAHAAHAEADRAARRAREARGELEDASATAARAASAATAELRAAAADLGLPVDPGELRSLRSALGEYRVALADVWPAVRERGAAAADAAVQREDADRLAAYAEEMAERSQAAENALAAARERHTTLKETVGAAVEELQRRLAENGAAQRDCAERRKAAQQELIEANKELASEQTRIADVDTRIEAAVASRGEAVAALRRFAATGLLGVALPDAEIPPVGEEWAVRPAVELARTIGARLADTDDSDTAWERVQKRLSAELSPLGETLSARGHQASTQSLEEGVVVRVVFNGREREVPELVGALAAEVEERDRLLTARQRELLENHLITEVAGSLQELIVAAERRVVEMNGELEERPTSTGMRLRLVWRPSRRDAPPGLEDARTRLLQDSDAWSPDDRAVLGDFLQGQINRVRAADQSGGTWYEHLKQALDYRSWHEFAVQRHQGGRWQPATGPASGGERVLSMSVPLFAAASGHYASAGDPCAPRLITLDEAFAGVDDDSRAKCLGLLASFDLDVVMTSEREWGCYPEVPGLAICQLSRLEGLPAVLVTRWRWDGHRRSRVAEAPSGAAGPAPGTDAGALGESREAAAAGQDALWS